MPVKRPKSRRARMPVANEISDFEDDDVVKLTICLRQGAEFEAVGGRNEAKQFHHRFKKFVDGQIHKTDNHKLLQFGGYYFYAETIAAYTAEDGNGKKVDLGPLN